MVLSFCRGRQAFVDICKGLSALHSNLICHSNLNSENVLIDTAGTCKISSLRSGRIMETGTSLGSTPDLGTPDHYKAPERIQGQAGLASDIWSLSIILWEVSYCLYLLTASRIMHRPRHPAGELAPFPEDKTCLVLCQCTAASKDPM